MSTPNTKKFGRVAVLMGGSSAERDISIKTGQNVLAALQQQGVDAVGIDVDIHIAEQLKTERVDRAFIALHGPGGEDGVIQGVLETLKIPYTGSGVAASSLTLNKAFTKWVWRANEIPTLDFLLLENGLELDYVIDRLGLPLCVKPVNEGSSFGVSRVDTAEDLPRAIAAAREFTQDIIIEPWISGRELTVCILNNEALPIIEVISNQGFYDYKSKYEPGFTEYVCPAALPEALSQEIRDICLQAFHVTGCESWGRVDLMLDQDNRPWLLEVNTIPGMTNTSLVPKAALVIGKSFEQSVLDILQGSL